MNYWLVKFSPKRSSWTDILVEGKFTIRGVRNYQARNNLENMKRGDRILFYHSQYELQVMGELQVIRPAYQDIYSTNSKWVSVDFAPVKTLEHPVSLQRIKQIEDLQEIGLIRQPRLAVMPLTKEEYHTIVSLSEEGK